MQFPDCRVSCTATFTTELSHPGRYSPGLKIYVSMSIPQPFKTAFPLYLCKYAADICHVHVHLPLLVLIHCTRLSA